MSDETTDAGRFFKEATEFYYELANTYNLGIGLGRWDHPRFGEMRVIAVYGWVGTLYVTLACCGTEAALANEQVRLLWYFADQTEHFEFRHVATRRPMSQTTTRGAYEMSKEVLWSLTWLGGKTIDQVIADQFERNIAPGAKAAEATEDVRVALAEEIPKGDEEDPA